MLLRKIDCVMIRVDDLALGVQFYCNAFGLRELWHDERSVGLGFPETDAEIVLHTDQGIPHRVEVQYLVDDVEAACEEYRHKGGTISVPPFAIAIGKCAVLADPFGTPICILDMSSGPRSIA